MARGLLTGFKTIYRVNLALIRHVSTISSRFNSLPAFQKFSFQLNRNKTGLFDIPQLTSPSGFSVLKDNVITESTALLNEATSTKRQRKLVQVFDDLSDALCRVADMADFVRVAHPKVKYREAAEDACVAVSIIVQQMNTNVELYNAVKRVVVDGDALASEVYTDTDKNVTKLFLDDFDKCGINLDETTRARFVHLSEVILMLEARFTQGTHMIASLSKEDLPPHLHHIFSGHGQLSLTSMNSDHADEAVREAAYRGYLLPNDTQQQLLDTLLAARDQLAKLAGYHSYAERALDGSLTGSPQNAVAFLEQLSDKLMPLTQQDFTKMEVIKRKISGSTDRLQPWDVSYCAALARKSCMEVNVSDISAYLSLGACMNGLAILVERLYGVRLEVVSPDPSELWHESVYKLEVRWQDSDDLIGYIYCDFFERKDKPRQDCHFTIQCGRQREDNFYQEPKVVLMMNFSPPSAFRPTLLSPQQLDNLFHEFGHAMHSMLGRTKYQHVSGTRCSTDFAEVPSILMEYFSSDYRVLKEFTSHYRTGEPMPESMAEQLLRSKAMFSASDTQLQVFYAMLDQRLHVSHAHSIDTMEILKDTQNKFYGLPHVPNTAWHLRFGHLVGYGAKYFSYLMSRAIAAQIWHKCFKADPFSRSGGLVYMNEVLAHGGGKPPAEMIQSLTGSKPTIESLVQSLITETVEDEEDSVLGFGLVDVTDTN